jgi:predicted RNase H-like HicB family nuclease
MQDRPKATVTPEADLFVARSLTPPVTSQGETVEKALANLNEAIDLYRETWPST